MKYKKLLEKYMRHVVMCEGTAFVTDTWDDNDPQGYTEEEQEVLLKLKNKIYKEKP